jgi:hypothetical protein
VSIQWRWEEERERRVVARFADDEMEFMSRRYARFKTRCQVERKTQKGTKEIERESKKHKEEME